MPALRGWHHLHVWAISTTENAATLHVVVDRLEEMAGVKRELKALFLAEGIGHCTIEFETTGAPCDEADCR